MTDAPAAERRQDLDTSAAFDASFGTSVPRSFLIALDVLTLALAFLLAYIVFPQLKSTVMAAEWAQQWTLALSPDIGDDPPPLHEVWWTFAVMSGVVVLGFQAMSGYRPLPAQTRSQLVTICVFAPIIGLGAIALIPFALRTPNWSRLFIFLFTTLTIASLASYRFGLRGYQIRRIASGFYARHVVLAGSPRAVAWTAEYLQRTTTRAHYQVMGYLTLRGPHPAEAVNPSLGLEPLGTVEALPDLLVHRPIHEVIAIQGGDGGAWLQPMVETCDYFRVTLRIVPEALLFGSLKDLQFLYRADPLRLPEVVLRPRDFASDALFLKRVMDIVLSATLLVALLPLFLLIAIAIKVTTPNLPVFYPWQVVGFRGRRFTGYKFSTMVADADERKASLMDRNEMEGPVFKIKEDPRVTPVGRYLRKFSLNELPQFWSVLKGDMSLVGPRPAFPHELERYELWHKRKLCVRPGLTCLWQIRGRNRISRFDDWVRMDLEYIDKWTLWLDVKILFRTVFAVVKGTGS